MASAQVNDPDVIEIIELMQLWHSSRIAKLQEILDAGPDVGIQLKSSDGKPVELDAMGRAGLMLGVDLAVRMFGKFPITMEPPAPDELDEEE